MQAMILTPSISQCQLMPRLLKTETPSVNQKKDRVYKLIELTSTSKSCIEDAVEKAIKRARKTVKNLKWFQIIETRGAIDKGKIDRWQVTLKVGFNVEDR